jgi:uncharacterized protein YxeA
MDASRTGHLGAAFVMHDADLDALNRLLKDFGDDIEYTITGKDGISLTFTEVNKLRAFENPRKKRIVKFSARVVNREPSRRAYLSLDSHWTQNVYVNIEGSQNMTTKLNEGISTWLDGMRPWYWWLARGNPLTFSILILLTCSLVFLNSWWGYRSGLRSSKPEEFLLPPLVTGGSFWLVAMGLMKGFPAGVFAIGQGKRRHDLSDRLRWLAVIGFPVSIIASVIAAVIYG